MSVKKNLKLWLAVIALALPLMFVGTASAMYMADGAASDPTGTAGWLAPTDGICVLSIDINGNMAIDATKHTARDCQAELISVTSVTSGQTLANVCGFTTGNTAGLKYSAPGSSQCVTIDGSGYITGSMSMVNLDRGAVMCNGLGGQLANAVAATLSNGAVISTPTKTVANGTAATCAPYGWLYAGQDANGAPMTFGAKGTTQGAGTGYCYASMNMTSAYGTAALCPSNQANVAPFNANAAYDWAFSSSKCTYAKGIAGWLNSALTKANGTTYAANSYLDLSTFTTQGACLANGGSWANWTGQAASTVSVPTTTTPSTIPAWDYTKNTPDADNGCLHCHSYLSQQNGPAERFKDSYLKTGHKNMLRKATAGKKLVDATGTPYTTDGTNAINFMTSSDPYAKITVSGVDQNLYYVYGDWMIALPTVVYGKNGYGSAPTGTTADNNGYSCYACHTTGAKDSSNIGVSGIGTSGYAGQEPQASYPNINLNSANPKWDRDGILCSRCHNAMVGPVNQTMINASAFPQTAPTSGGMGALAAGTGRTNLCFGCHQSIGKDWPAGTTTADPTKIPTGVSHGAAPGRDFNGHVLGNSFLNSVHSNYTGTIRLNSIGKYDLSDPNGTSEYNSLFKGYTCWQSWNSSSPGKTKADGSEIKTKAECDALYSVGSVTSAWRADASGDLGTLQGSCSTCHDVHNSLFVASQEEAAIRKTCKDCHVNNATTGATDAAAPQVVIASINHPMTGGTPFDAGLFGDDPCAVCHMAIQAELNGDQNTMPAHVWRINTNASYNTFPSVGQFYGGVCSVHTGTLVNAATKFVQAIYPSDVSSAACTTTSVGGTWTSQAKDQNAQTAPDSKKSNAVWVDIDMACGQCHGGSGGTTATHNGAPYFTKAALASGAAQMHNAGYVPPVGTTPVVSHGTPTQTGYTVSFTDSSTDSGDTSNQDAVTVNWGDGTTDTGFRGGVFSHTFTGRARNVSIVHMVRNSVNSNLYAKETLKLNVPVKYNVTGTVLQSDGLTAITSATVVLRVNGHTRQMTTSNGSGAFTFTNVLPGSYAIHVYKSGVTFGADVPVTVTTANVPQNVTAITP
jgi:Carboxypeptidase regulatory-like domain/Doubled CXXCH motif (Paired_CXXCH_1)